MRVIRAAAYDRLAVALVAVLRAARCARRRRAAAVVRRGEGGVRHFRRLAARPPRRAAVGSRASTASVRRLDWVALDRRLAGAAAALDRGRGQALLRAPRRRLAGPRRRRVGQHLAHARRPAPARRLDADDAARRPARSRARRLRRRRARSAQKWDQAQAALALERAWTQARRSSRRTSTSRRIAASSIGLGAAAPACSARRPPGSTRARPRCSSRCCAARTRRRRVVAQRACAVAAQASPGIACDAIRARDGRAGAARYRAAAALEPRAASRGASCCKAPGERARHARSTPICSAYAIAHRCASHLAELDGAQRRGRRAGRARQRDRRRARVRRQQRRAVGAPQVDGVDGAAAGGLDAEAVPVRAGARARC